ncbi:hypothetical protein FXO37_17279 [Capsicum annuum]|nr:hypothetical protein FXO37_17279 [Capsicum annuum]
MLCNACGLRWRTRQTLDGCVPKHANGEIQSSQLPSEIKPARDDQKLEVGVEVSGQHGSSACLEEEMNNISAIGSAGSASDNCIQMEETNGGKNSKLLESVTAVKSALFPLAISLVSEIGVFGRDKMGDHNMRLHEMRKEIDALKGSMEGVASSVSKMGEIVDTKNGPCDGQGNGHREAPIVVDERNSEAAEDEQPEGFRTELFDDPMGDFKDLRQVSSVKDYVDNFHWTAEATATFEQLKSAITSALMLALLDFSKSFVLEIDASGVGIGAVLLQEGRPIAFFSEGLVDKKIALSVYERELLALVTAVQKWRSYLLGRHFTIKTVHHSLKFLLEQRITTPSLQKWLAKLIDYDFDISLKTSKENVVANALSRREDYVQLCIISGVQAPILEEVKLTWAQNPTLHKLLQDLQDGGNLKPQYKFQGGVLSRRMKQMKQDVYQFVRECDTCQRCKHDTTLPVGLLQPLLIPGKLKKKLGGQVTTVQLPEVHIEAGYVILALEAILNRRLALKKGTAVTQVLVKWLNAPMEDREAGKDPLWNIDSVPKRKRLVLGQPIWSTVERIQRQIHNNLQAPDYEDISDGDETITLIYARNQYIPPNEIGLGAMLFVPPPTTTKCLMSVNSMAEDNASCSMYVPIENLHLYVNLEMHA